MKVSLNLQYSLKGKEHLIYLEDIFIKAGNESAKQVEIAIKDSWKRLTWSVNGNRIQESFKRSWPIRKP